MTACEPIDAEVVSATGIELPLRDV
jgi:hypothetical protein